MRVGGFLLALLFPVVAVAQAPTVTVGTPFVIEADHDGLHTHGYRLKVQAGSDVPVTRLKDGVIAIEAVAATPGLHTVTVEAVNQDGSAPSAPLIVRVVEATPKPPQPCAYIPKGASVGETRPVGYVLKGVIRFQPDKDAAIERLRLFKAWGWDVHHTERLTEFDVNAKCVGL